MYKTSFIWLVMGWIFLLASAGCSHLAGKDAAIPSASEPAPTTQTKAPTAVSSPTKSPTPTHTPEPSATPFPTASATVTLTSTPTLHPMNILAARQTPYPGSLITIEETLEPGANYSRYIARYESDGLTIYGLLTIPNGERPAAGWPSIVFNHGYIPPQEYRTTERYIAYVNSLARHGYIVFRIDYRGHDSSEGEATGAYGNPGYMVDVLNAVSSLKTLPEADPQRIGMWGHSMGGFLTLRAMVISPDIKAGVIWAGVVGSYPDLICCWRWPIAGVTTSTPNPNFRSGWRTRWQDLYGSPEESPEFWMGISANNYLGDLSGPIQLHHGTADSEVPIAFSRELHQQTLQAGKTVEYYEYPDDDHNISGYFSQAMSRTIQFFDRYLKGP